MPCSSRAQGVHVVVGYAYEAGRQRSVLVVRAGIVAHGDHGDGAAVEVALAADNLDFVVLNALLHRTPAAGQLQGRLHALGARVHGQHAVVAEVLVHELLILAQRIVVERAAGEAQHVGLVFQCLHNAGVAVALVHGRVAAEKVEVALAVDVPHIDAFAAMQHHGQWVIVVCAVVLFQLHELAHGSFFLCCHCIIVIGF